LYVIKKPRKRGD